MSHSSSLSLGDLLVNWRMSPTVHYNLRKFKVAAELGLATSETMEEGTMYRHYDLFLTRNDALEARRIEQLEIDVGARPNLAHMYDYAEMFSFTECGGVVVLWVEDRDGNQREVKGCSEEFEDFRVRALEEGRTRGLGTIRPTIILADPDRSS